MNTPPTSIEFHILLALADGPRHGYGIMQDVYRLTARQLEIGPGTLYGVIKRLLQVGVIVECQPDRERRRCYALTNKGRRIATAEAERLAALVDLARQNGLLAAL